MDEGTLWRQRTRRAGELAGRLAQIHKELIDLTVELLADAGWAGDGVKSPAHWLQVYTGLGTAQAKYLVRVAERHDVLSPVTERMSQGRLTLDQAALVAHHVPDEAIDQVAHLAEQTTVTQLARVVAHYPWERSPQHYEEPRTPAHHRPATLSMHHRDGRFHLALDTTTTDGALIEQAIREAKDALFTAGDTEATLADGLSEVCSRSLAAISSPDRRDHYRVLLHLSTDGHGWLGQRGAIPPALAASLTCDGQVRPIWEQNSRPIAVGRSQRIVPHRTRRLIEDRDGGCRYPGCAVTGFLNNHHIVSWQNGGATDPDNLVSLCPRHHRALHQGEFSIEGNPEQPDGLTFLNRLGYPVHRSRTRPDNSSPQPPPPIKRTAVRGERLDLGAIDLDIRPRQTASAMVNPTPRLAHGP